MLKVWRVPCIAGRTAHFSGTKKLYRTVNTVTHYLDCYPSASAGRETTRVINQRQSNSGSVGSGRLPTNGTLSVIFSPLKVREKKRERERDKREEGEEARCTGIPLPDVNYTKSSDGVPHEPTTFSGNLSRDIDLCFRTTKSTRAVIISNDKRGIERRDALSPGSLRQVLCLIIRRGRRQSRLTRLHLAITLIIFIAVESRNCRYPWCADEDELWIVYCDLKLR